MTENRRYRITGRVQGVSFRASTRDKALELGLYGWVRNCPDGSVEVQARGASAALEQLEKWLWQGPEQASVSAVESMQAASRHCAGFEILD